MKYCQAFFLVCHVVALYYCEIKRDKTMNYLEENEEILKVRCLPANFDLSYYRSITRLYVNDCVYDSRLKYVVICECSCGVESGRFICLEILKCTRNKSLLHRKNDMIFFPVVMCATNVLE